jgi:hypothetical protein
MNLDTLHLLERPYGEVVDDLLTALVGGVVNEPLEYDLKIDAYPLSQPARALRGVTGTVAEERHAFVPGVDFRFSEPENALVWEEDGARPDDETTFFVDYFLTDSRSPLTDLNVGSVTRTLAEAVGREIATVYRQIHRAYLAGFIDTATGTSLDLVVAILGVSRKTGEFASGLATFYRDPAVTGNITIPQGLGLTTDDGDVVFETTEPRTLQRGQTRVDVPIRAAEGFAGEVGIVPAGAIREMTAPVAGVAKVTHFDPTVLAAGDETDEELRLRAKAALRALGKGTLAALDRAIREGRGLPIELWDPNGPPTRRTSPGAVTVLLEAEPERLPSLATAVHETRAAGVLTTLVARYVYVTPRVAARVSGELTGPGRAKVQEEMIAALQGYVDGLGSGEPAEGEAMLAALATVPDVSEVQVRDVRVSRADLDRPGTDSPSALAATLARALAEAPGDADPAAVLAGVLAEVPPVGLDRRVPDRSLLRSTAEERDGEPAGDEDLEAGTFRVVAEVDGETWWIALDMEPADVRLLTEGEA